MAVVTLLGNLSSIADAAKMACVSPFTVRSWLAKGWLKRVKVGRRTLVDLNEFENFVRKRNGYPDWPAQDWADTRNSCGEQNQ